MCLEDVANDQLDFSAIEKPSTFANLTRVASPKIPESSTAAVDNQ